MADPYIFNCTVKKIIDGDTVDVDIDLGFDCWLRSQRIRLAGIDTPECRTRDKQEKVFGLAAKGFVENFIPVGATAILKTKEKGKYGRYLGDLKVGSKWLCKQLLANHHAVEYGQSKEETTKAHIVNRSRVILDVG